MAKTKNTTPYFWTCATCGQRNKIERFTRENQKKLEVKKHCPKCVKHTVHTPKNKAK